MNNEEIKPVIDQVLAECLVIENEEIKPEKRIVDLGADSLDLVEIVLELETKLSVSISDEKMERIVTVQDLYDCVNNIKNEEENASSPR